MTEAGKAHLRERMNRTNDKGDHYCPRCGSTKTTDALTSDGFPGNDFWCEGCGYAWSLSGLSR